MGGVIAAVVIALARKRLAPAALVACTMGTCVSRAIRLDRGNDNVHVCERVGEHGHVGVLARFTGDTSPNIRLGPDGMNSDQCAVFV